ncbi:hypothetical protein ARMGADRAFT_1092520 [Armillaria gallica]|uniref:Uncharacterized protein n=1 Tax=Armillaria gallica TaxID=47427 RepID=A0A2H3CP11_ARMGA|nr:hypothetical protein ARMGADRAFT_1092520 [Armillaria gallica]
MKSRFYKGSRNCSLVSPTVPNTSRTPHRQPRCPSPLTKGKSIIVALASVNKTCTFHRTAQSTATPSYVLYRAPQLCVDPKLIDPGFLYGERDWSEEEEEEEEQKHSASPSRKRKTLTRKKAQGTDTQSPKKKARSTPAKPRASTSKAAVASPQKKGRK